MTSLLRSTMGAFNSGFKQRRDDIYETPPAAVEALMRVEPLPAHIWEPCCASGKIVNVLEAHGHQVTAHDLIGDRIDFLMEYRAPAGAQAIVTNPPYKLAGEFIRHGLELVPKVIMLLRLNFLESTSRSDIIDSGHLRIHLFANRIPMMHRDNYIGPRAPRSAIPFAWYVWDMAYNGPIIVNRIRV